MPDIVIPEFMGETAVAELAVGYDVLYDPNLVERPAELRTAVATAQALIVRNRTEVDAALLDSATRLKVIGRLGVGLDNIDLDVCEARGIAVVRADLENVVSVAEYVIAGILMLLRRAYQATADVLAGNWPRTNLIGHEISGKTLGLVGFGAIARAVAARAVSLGMRVIAYDPFVEESDSIWSELSVSRRADLKEVLSEAHVLSLHVPLTAETRNLIDRGELEAMKPGAVLINAARGGVVEECALAEALRAGRLKGAMLDVFEDEPLSAGSHLADVPNLILTPHIAGVTEESNERVSRLVGANVRRVLEEGQ